jgi:hypothetical protein
MLVSFRVSMVPPPPASPAARLDVFVIPGWAFYMFLAATIISLILTHLILAFHRSVTVPWFSEEEERWLKEKG